MSEQATDAAAAASAQVNAGAEQKAESTAEAQSTAEASAASDTSASDGNAETKNAEAAAPQPAETDQGEPDPNTGWLPLESNPDVVNPFAHAMGLPRDWGFCDVLGFEDWAFDMVPKPVAAVVLLFASSDAARKFKLKQHAEIVERGGQTIDPNLFYLTQVDGIGNACGTIACMHALLNGSAHFQLSPSPLTQFASTAAKLNPLERGLALLKAEGLREISDSTASNEAASTACPEAHEATNAHFIAFVEREGTLYELDGRKAFPINHGASTPETLLQDAAKVIRRDFMDVNPTEMRFNTMALAKIGE